MKQFFFAVLLTLFCTLTVAQDDFAYATRIAETLTKILVDYHIKTGSVMPLTRANVHYLMRQSGARPEHERGIFDVAYKLNMVLTINAEQGQAAAVEYMKQSDLDKGDIINIISSGGGISNYGGSVTTYGDQDFSNKGN